MRVFEECGAIVFDRVGESVLIIFQRESQKWGLPKGHVNPNEGSNYFECAKRELEEETGIMMNLIKYRRVGTCVIRNKLFYIVQLMKDIHHLRPIDHSEIGGIQWLNVQRIADFVTKQSCNVTLREFPMIRLDAKVY